MNTFDILEKIDNGDLHTTKGVYPIDLPENPNRQQGAKRIRAFESYCTIMDCVSNKLATGDCEKIDEYHHYSNLRLTKKGTEKLRFGQLTLKDIDNSYGKDSIQVWLLRPVIVAVLTAILTAPISGIIGFYIGKELSKEQQSPKQTIKTPNKPINRTENTTILN